MQRRGGAASRGAAAALRLHLARGDVREAKRGGMKRSGRRAGQRGLAGIAPAPFADAPWRLTARAFAIRSSAAKLESVSRAGLHRRHAPPPTAALLTWGRWSALRAEQQCRRGGKAWGRGTRVARVRGRSGGPCSARHEYRTMMSADRPGRRQAAQQQRKAFKFAAAYCSISPSGSLSQLGARPVEKLFLLRR